MDNLVIRMANGEYKSPYFGGDDPKEITLRLDLFEDSMFVIRYIPCKPPKPDLEMLVSDLYRQIKNRLGCEVGEYSDVCSSWTFPIDYYFKFIEEFRNRISPEKFKIEKLPKEIETVLRTRKTEEEDVEINLPTDFIRMVLKSFYPKNLPFAASSKSKSKPFQANCIPFKGQESKKGSDIKAEF